MKKFTKLLGIVLIIALVMSMGIMAYATEGGTTEGGGTSTATASITINRDSTWDATADNAEATFTYYKIFDAKDIDAANEIVVYTVDSEAKANALPDIFETNLAADGLYYVTLVDENTGAAAIATALKTMVDANPTLFPGIDVTSDANPVEITGLDLGYYLIEASNGSVLAVQTLDDVTINEKNDYPKVDKQQGEDATTITYAGDAVKIEVGDYINYQVTVSIPANANKDIVVVDTMSAGLEYDSTTGLTYSPDISGSIATVASTDAGYKADATWSIKIPAATVIANKGTDIVITYRAKVTEDALTDTGKENEVTLTYDDGNYVLTDTVDYEIYFGGIYKIDPNDSSADMSGVKFELTSGDDPVMVTYDETNGYYVVDPDSTSNEVETRADGNYYTIKIRGLDGDKTYTLTETETVSGYNLLETPHNLTLTKDDGTAFADKELDTFDEIENNKGTLLPSTGGIGTTIFYVVGSILVVAAGVLLITKKRMSREG